MFWLIVKIIFILFVTIIVLVLLFTFLGSIWEVVVELLDNLFKNRKKIARMNPKDYQLFNSYLIKLRGLYNEALDTPPERKKQLAKEELEARSLFSEIYAKAEIDFSVQAKINEIRRMRKYFDQFR